MKQIIIEKEWLEVLDSQSPEFLSRVISALCAFILHDTAPDGLSQAEQVAYDFLLKNVLRYQEQYDLEAGYEAVIKRKRAEEARQRRAALKSKQDNATADKGKMIQPVKDNQNYLFRPLPADDELNMKRTSTDDYHYPRFVQFYQSYIGPKDSCETEYARFKHQYPENLSLSDLLLKRLDNRYRWARDLAKLGFCAPQLPTLREFITNQCWNDRLPDLSR